MKIQSKPQSPVNRSSNQDAVRRFGEELDVIIRRLFDSNVHGIRRPDHSSIQYLQGEFITPARVPRNPEVDIPSVFMPWDDPGEIDWARIPPVASLSMGAAIALRELLKTSSRFQAEWEFIVVIDLSRSMLSEGMLQKNGASNDKKVNAKLDVLFKSAAAFIHVAEAAGFILRTLYVAGGRVAFEERVLRPKAYALRAMILMRKFLLNTFSRTLENLEEVEPYSLGKGLKQAMKIQSQSFIIVISDFLDPLNPDLNRIVAEAMKRHNVHLVDVAAERDRNFPPPKGWRDWETKRIELPFGARHLERGCQERPISRSQAKKWNEERSHDVAMLKRSASKLNARWHDFGQRSYPAILGQAMGAFVK